jgi:hypothetical protein
MSWGDKVSIAVSPLRQDAQAWEDKKGVGATGSTAETSRQASSAWRRSALDQSTKE